MLLHWSYAWAWSEKQLSAGTFCSTSPQSMPTLLWDISRLRKIGDYLEVELVYWWLVRWRNTWLDIRYDDWWLDWWVISWICAHSSWSNHHNFSHCIVLFRVTLTGWYWERCGLRRDYVGPHLPLCKKYRSFPACMVISRKMVSLISLLPLTANTIAFIMCISTLCISKTSRKISYIKLCRMLLGKTRILRSKTSHKSIATPIFALSSAAFILKTNQQLSKHHKFKSKKPKSMSHNPILAAL
jgi:hypothetical protein